MSYIYIKTANTLVKIRTVKLFLGTRLSARNPPALCSPGLADNGARETTDLLLHRFNINVTRPSLLGPRYNNVVAVGLYIRIGFSGLFSVPERNSSSRQATCVRLANQCRCIGSLVNRSIEHKLCAPLELVTMVPRAGMHRPATATDTDR